MLDSPVNVHRSIGSSRRSSFIVDGNSSMVILNSPTQDELCSSMLGGESMNGSPTLGTKRSHRDYIGTLPSFFSAEEGVLNLSMDTTVDLVEMEGLGVEEEEEEDMSIMSLPSFVLDRPSPPIELPLSSSSSIARTRYTTVDREQQAMVEVMERQRSVVFGRSLVRPASA